MTRLGTSACIVAALATIGGLATYQRHALRELERKQVALSESVELTQREAKASHLERAAAFATLAQSVAQSGAQAQAAAPATPASPPQPSAEVSVLEPPPDRQAYLASVDSSFAAEKSDGAWDHAASEAVRSRLSGQVDNSLVSIDCRASMCRVVTEDAGVDEASAMIRLVVGSPGDEVWSGAYVSRLEEGSSRHPQRVTYFMRKGVGLPVL